MTSFKTRSLILRILSVLTLIFIVVALYRINIGGSPPTFTDFMRYITDIPTISIPNFGSSLYTLLNNANWGAFDFFRILFANLATLLDFAIYLINMLVQISTVLIYFVRWVFVV